MTIQEIIAVALLLAGAFFMFVGSLGLIRLPDFFSRTHAAGMTDTLGIMLMLGGLAVYEGWSLISAKLVAIIIFVAIVNPVTVHALAKAALEYGIKPQLRNDDRKGETKDDVH